MTVYARIEDGVVREVLDTPHDIQNLFHGSLVWVDATRAQPQPAHGWRYANGSFSPPPPPPPPAPKDVAAQLTTAGCAVTSKTDGVLNGTFPLDPASLRGLVALQTRINAQLGLPHGDKTVKVFDTAGKPHELTAEQVTKLAQAVDDYAYDLDMLARGQAEAPPKQPVEIS